MTTANTKRFSYFLWIAMIGLLAVLIGFAKTFILPVSKGSFSAPNIVYIHGAFAFSWILLFILQTSLIHLRKYNTHIIFGTIGILIAFGTAITMLQVGVYATNRDFKLGLGEIAISNIVVLPLPLSCLYPLLSPGYGIEIIQPPIKD